MAAQLRGWAGAEDDRESSREDQRGRNVTMRGDANECGGDDEEPLDPFVEQPSETQPGTAAIRSGSSAAEVISVFMGVLLLGSASLSSKGCRAPRVPPSGSGFDASGREIRPVRWRRHRGATQRTSGQQRR